MFYENSTLLKDVITRIITQSSTLLLIDFFTAHVFSISILMAIQAETMIKIN